MSNQSGDVVFRERPETIVASPPHQTSSGLFFSHSTSRLSPTRFAEHSKSEKYLEAIKHSETSPRSPRTADMKISLPDLNQPTDVPSPSQSSPRPAASQKRKVSFNFTPHKDFGRVSENPLYAESQSTYSVSPSRQDIDTPQRIQTPPIQSPVHRSSTPRTPLADIDSPLTRNLFLGSPNSPTFADKLYAEVCKQSPSPKDTGSPPFSLLPPAINSPDSPDSLFVGKVNSSKGSMSHLSKSRISFQRKENVAPVSAFGAADGNLRQAETTGHELRVGFGVTKQLGASPSPDVSSVLSHKLTPSETGHSGYNSEPSVQPIAEAVVSARAPPPEFLNSAQPASTSSQTGTQMEEQIRKKILHSGLGSIGKLGLAFVLVTAAVLSSKNPVFLPQYVWDEPHVAVVRELLRKSEIPQQLSTTSAGLKFLWTPFDPKRDEGAPDWRWSGLGLGHHLRPVIRLTTQAMQIIRSVFLISSQGTVDSEQLAVGKRTGSPTVSESLASTVSGVFGGEKLGGEMRWEMVSGGPPPGVVSLKETDVAEISIGEQGKVSHPAEDKEPLDSFTSDAQTPTPLAADINRVGNEMEEALQTKVSGREQSIADLTAPRSPLSGFLEAADVRRDEVPDMSPESEDGDVDLSAFSSWEPASDVRDNVKQAGEGHQSATECSLPFELTALSALAVVLVPLALMFFLVRITMGGRKVQAVEGEAQSDMTSDLREPAHQRTPGKGISGPSHAELEVEVNESAEYGSFEAYMRATNAEVSVHSAVYAINPNKPAVTLCLCAL